MGRHPQILVQHGSLWHAQPHHQPAVEQQHLY